MAYPVLLRLVATLGWAPLAAAEAAAGKFVRGI